MSPKLAAKLIRYLKNKPRSESFALCVLSAGLQLVRGFTTDENELLISLRGKHAKLSALLIAQQADNQSMALLRNMAHNFKDSLDTTSRLAVSMAQMEPLKGVRIPVVLCGAPGVKTKIFSTEKKGPGCKHRSRPHGEEWRSVSA